MATAANETAHTAPQTTSKLLVGAGVLFVAIAVLGWAFGYAQGEVTTVKKVGTTTTTTTDRPPSDTLLSALIGTGAALLLIGALSGRIHTLKVPNVLELELSEKEAVAKAVAKNVKRTHPNASPEEAAKIGAIVTAKALPAIAAFKAASPRDQITDDEVDALAGYLATLTTDDLEK